MNRGGQFFHHTNRKLRQYINLATGLDEGHPFQYFSPDSKFDFAYGPAFHHAHDNGFFSPMQFNPQSKFLFK